MNNIIDNINNQNQIKSFSDIEDISRSIDSLDDKILKNTLAYLIKVYIIDKGISYEGAVRDNMETPYTGNTGNVASALPAVIPSAVSFCDLIADIKKKFAFPELNLFSVDGGKVYITINGKKDCIIGEVRGTQKETAGKSVSQKAGDNSHEFPGRFKNLEMD